MDEPIHVKIVISLIGIVAWSYSVLTFLPCYFITWPSRRHANRIKAKLTTGDGTTSSSSYYRSTDCPNGLLTITPVQNCDTLDQLFSSSVYKWGLKRCLGTRQLLKEEDEVQSNGKVFKKLVFGDYTWETYEVVDQRIENFGRGLASLGQQPRDNLVIFSETRAEYMISVQACFRYNFPVGTLYATLGEDAIAHGINETEAIFVITSASLLPKLLAISDQIPKVKCIIYFEDQLGHANPSRFPSGIKVHSFSAVEKTGERVLTKPYVKVKPKPDDIAVIMYTSGSTGVPKGVMISHSNLLAGTSGQCRPIQGLGSSDVYIGYLPLAHVLELSAELCLLGFGASIGYSSPLTLTDQSSKIKRGTQGDATALQPTMMAAVPAILERVAKNVLNKVSQGSAMQRAFFNFAYSYKTKHVEMGLDTPILNRIVFSKVCSLLGGRVRLLLCGGAPLLPSTQRFINVCFCCPMMQGYGLTETCGAGTIVEVDDRMLNHVGSPLTCNNFKLENWEEGGYTTGDRPNPRGEILIGGGNVTMGYYRNPKKTAEDFEVVGSTRWFHTGDIGEFLPDGRLKVIDRKKDLVKLQAGEYVSLAKVEGALKESPYVENVCAYADSNSMYTIALIVPDRNQLQLFADQVGSIDLENWQEMSTNEKLEKEVLKSINKVARKGKLEKFEIPQRIKLCSEVWTPDTGLVTDAYKLKRKALSTYYKADIAKLYS